MNARRWFRTHFHALVAVSALPVLGGAGTCGILFDLWSWDEVTQHADRTQMEVDEGAQKIVGYQRKNIWLQRHVYAFEGSLSVADYHVEDDVFIVEFTCDGPATCFADHWLELPEAMPVDAHVGKGSIIVDSLSGDLSLSIDEGFVEGDDLTSLEFTLEGDSLDHVSLRWTSPPESVAIDIADGDVELTIPAGAYVCDLAGAADTNVDPTIVCDDTATNELHVDAGDGSVSLVPTT